MILIWDEPKRETNLRAHKLDFRDARDRFDFTTALITPSYRGRFVAIGPLDGRVVTVVFKPLGSEGISLISLRPASRKERRAHG